MPRFVAWVFSVLLLPATLWAQEPTELVLPQQPDVRIIVDISGSMKETDPNNLRQPAVRLLARIIPEGSTAGVWTFGQYVNMLVPHGEVARPWRETAVEQSKKINSVALRTNLGKAIEVASDDYVTGGTLQNTHFILLTDGKVDISDSADKNRAEERRILDTVLENLVARGATFHPVALSGQADAGFLKTLAEQSRGSFHVADTAESLNLAFLDALNTAAPQEQIPIEGNAFTVDAGVQEFTALIFRGDSAADTAEEPAALELVNPEGRTLTQTGKPDKIRWARETGYDLITIKQPQAGEWRLKGELGEGSRVTVVSDLRMVVGKIPATFTAKSPVDVRVAFFEDGEKVTRSEFLDVLEVTLSLTSEDGRSGRKTLSADTPPQNGEYTDSIGKLPAAGSYRVDIVADGKTFARKFTATTEFLVPVSMVESTVAAPIDIAMAEQPVKPEAPEMPDTRETPAPAAEPPQPEPPAEAEPAVTSEPPAQQTSRAEPEADTEPATDQASPWLPVPVWMLATGGGALASLLLIFLVLRKRRSVPVVSEPVLQPEPELQEGAEPVLQPEPELQNETAEPADEDIPVANTVVEPEETIPQLDEPSENRDDEEFGMEDFDLSEFDDLPDYDSASEDLPDNSEPGRKPTEDQKT